MIKNQLQGSSAKLGAETKLSIKNLVILPDNRQFFYNSRLKKFKAYSSTTLKRANFEGEKFIKEGNLTILWSNPSNFDILLLLFEYGNPIILL